jgi:hypothetical protein
MKYFLSILVFSLISCKSSQQTTSTVTKDEPLKMELSNCDDNFNCTIELLPNKQLTFKADEFGVMYAEVTEGESLVFKYHYQKKHEENLADGSYTEIIYAELNNPISNSNLTNDELQTIKLHLGRFCYCKGSTGYFPITTGVFKLTKIENEQLKIELNFSLKKVPHRISSVQEIISLKSTGSN